MLCYLVHDSELDSLKASFLYDRRKKQHRPTNARGGMLNVLITIYAQHHEALRLLQIELFISSKGFQIDHKF